MASRLRNRGRSYIWFYRICTVCFWLWSCLVYLPFVSPLLKCSSSIMVIVILTVIVFLFKRYKIWFFLLRRVIFMIIIIRDVHHPLWSFICRNSTFPVSSLLFSCHAVLASFNFGHTHTRTQTHAYIYIYIYIYIHMHTCTKKNIYI